MQFAQFSKTHLTVRRIQFDDVKLLLAGKVFPLHEEEGKCYLIRLQTPTSISPT